MGRGGRGREEVLVIRAWRRLDSILSCCCCFEGVENGRLLLFCLAAVAQVSWWTWVGGEGEEGWGRLGPIRMSVLFSLE